MRYVNIIVLVTILVMFIFLPIMKILCIIKTEDSMVFVEKIHI